MSFPLPRTFPFLNFVTLCSRGNCSLRLQTFLGGVSPMAIRSYLMILSSPPIPSPVVRFSPSSLFPTMVPFPFPRGNSTHSMQQPTIHVFVPTQSSCGRSSARVAPHPQQLRPCRNRSRQQSRARRSRFRFPPRCGSFRRYDVQAITCDPIITR